MAPDVAADAAAARPGSPRPAPAEQPAPAAETQVAAPERRPDRPVARRPADVGSEPDSEPGAPRAAA